MRQRWRWAVIFGASGASCGPSQPMASETFVSSPPPQVQVEQGHDQIVHLAPFDLGAAQDVTTDDSPLREVLSRERETLLGCWGTSAGRITLSLEVDLQGLVLGGSTEPAGGQEGLAAIADCVLAQARAWRFPAGDTGGTRVLVAPLFSSSGER